MSCPRSGWIFLHEKWIEFLHKVNLYGEFLLFIVSHLNIKIRAILSQSLAEKWRCQLRNTATVMEKEDELTVQ